MAVSKLGGARQGILSLTIKDKNALYAAYLQFVKNGGLFIPTTKGYQLGDEVFMFPPLPFLTWALPRRLRHLSKCSLKVR
jgi:type IV pilus assembly protein PilZ